MKPLLILICALCCSGCTVIGKWPGFASHQERYVSDEELYSATELEQDTDQIIRLRHQIWGEPLYGVEP